MVICIFDKKKACFEPKMGIRLDLSAIRKQENEVTKSLRGDIALLLMKTAAASISLQRRNVVGTNCVKKESTD